MACPICGSTTINNVVHRSGMPIHQNGLFDTEKAARECIKKDIDMVICVDCGFIYNDSFDDTLDLYSENYNNAQSASENFLSYMKSSVEYLWDKYYIGGGPRRICEIGCGKEADYIKLIYDKICSQNVINDFEIIGYDPSSRYYSDRNIKIYPRYFDLDNEDCKGFDLLICRHVVEHIKNPLLLFKNTYGLNEKSLAFFETPDVEWILKNNVFFDFFWEHCSLFSDSSIYRVAEILDINVLEIKKSFNRQYMWVITQNESCICDKSEFYRSRDNLLTLSSLYAENENIIISKIRDILNQKRKSGKVVVWGAGAKANTFLNLFDSDVEVITGVVDINSKKWGKYIAGTGHGIFSPDLLEKEEIKTVIVMNGNYYDEIVQQIHKRNTAVYDIVALDSLLKG